ncbi:hypothetical protein DL93DRAFT_92802 [Clavulina sp. PMI_390]|nr:hypothetical protein DL93DRAFT_92802 [Clavulina sp. PMI_390]
MSPVLSSETTVSTSSLASDETLVSFADSTWHHPNHPRSATAESESSMNTDATQRGRSSAKGKGVCGSRLASALCGSHAGANANGSANGSSASLAASSSRSSSKARTTGSSNGPVSGTAAGVVSSSYSVPQPSPKPKRRYGHAWRASFDGHSTALAALTPTEDDQLYHGSDSELPSPSGSSNGGLRRFRDVLRSRSQSRPRTMSSKTIPRPPPSTSPLTLVTPGLEPATPTLQILTSSPTESLTNTPGIGSVALVSAPSSSSAGTSSASSTAPSGHSHSRSSTFATSPSVQTDGSMSPPPFPLSAFKSPISPSMPLSTPTPHAKTPLFHRPGILKRASSSSRSRARPGSAASSRVPSESSPAPPVPSLSASPSASTSNHSCPLSGSASSKPKKEKKVKPPPLRTTYTYTFAAVPSDDEDAGPAAHEHETSEQHAAGRHSVDEHVRIALGHDAHGQTPAADTTEHSHSHPHGHSPPQRKHTHTAVPIFVQLAPRPAGSLPEHIMPKVATPTTVVDEFGNLINIPAGSDATVGAGKCPLADKQERARVDSTSKPPVSARRVPSLLSICRQNETASMIGSEPSLVSRAFHLSRSAAALILRMQTPHPSFFALVMS